MSSWLALLLAPGLALISLSLLYAWAMPACGVPVLLPVWLMQGLPLLALLVNLLIAMHAWGLWRRMAGDARQQPSRQTAPALRNVVAYLGVWSGLLFSLLVLLLWLAAWFFSPCW
ncbi:MAG TPA: hypothetical protein VN023_02155 [Methylovorus sp.]|jgi:hypothetical protein|nr:hypothetical protein [Methylovorus sp.]